MSSYKTYASNDSVIVPIWLIFNSNELHASFSLAVSIRSIFVASRSSPTISIGQFFLKTLQAAQSSSANGSSRRMIGYLSINERYRSAISLADNRHGFLLLKPRSYFPSL